VAVIGFVCKKCLDMQPIEQFRHWFGFMPLVPGQHIAQWVDQGVADGVDFGITAPARDVGGLQTYGFARSCRKLTRPVTGRIHHYLLHVGLLHALEKALEKALEITSAAIALIKNASCAQPRRQSAPSVARANHPQQGVENVLCSPLGRPLQAGIKSSKRFCCSSVKV